MENFLKAENVSFCYDEGENGKNVFSNLSLNVEKGSFVAVLGHNGCGKSTLAKLFNAILLPQTGSVVVEDMSTADEKNLFNIRSKVGMVFQNPDNQIVATIVEDDVAFALENMGVEPDEIRRRVDDALATVSMTENALRAPHELSGGQKQRVAIAGVIAMSPDCVVLDEPTAMLDPKGRAEVISTIKKLNSELGVTIVLITHNMDEAALADRVVVMDKGKIVMDDVPQKIFSQVEKMRQLGLDVPQVTYLSYLLKGTPFEIREDVLTVRECVDELLRVIKKEGSRA